MSLLGQKAIHYVNQLVQTLSINMSLSKVLSYQLEVCYYCYVNSSFKLINIGDPNQFWCMMVSCFDWQWVNLFDCRMINKACSTVISYFHFNFSHWSFKWLHVYVWKYLVIVINESKLVNGDVYGQWPPWSIFLLAGMQIKARV